MAALVADGKNLAKPQANHVSAEEIKLNRTKNKELPHNRSVETMKLTKDKSAKFSRNGALAAALLAWAVFAAPGAEEPRDGRIEFSDGAAADGKISLTPGGALKIESGPQIRVLDLDRVREIRISPESEEMDRNWRFKEAGQTAKEFFGEPYPVRNLQATVLLAGGESFTGHLYSTVLYVEGAETTQKVLLLSKQRGDEGQSLSSLVYPVRISFAGATAADAPTVTLRFMDSHRQMFEPGNGIAAVTRGALLRLTVTPTVNASEFKMTSPLGREFFLAIQGKVRDAGFPTPMTHERIVVPWPAEKDEKTLAQVQSALPKSEDFFDDRRVLGVLRDPAAADIYSLILAARKGQTTLAATRSQPWRLEIYRWKTEAGSGRLMLAGQNYLFRGIGAKDEAVPEVELSAKLWPLHKEGQTWRVGE
jgi:hypothetical protein